MFTLFFGRHRSRRHMSRRHIGAQQMWTNMAASYGELCKFLRNISMNICGLGKRTDLKLGEVSCLFISNKITIS